MKKFRPAHKNDIQLFNPHSLFKLASDLIISLCETLEVKLEEIDRASMIFGLDIPIDFGIEDENLSTKQMRKIEDSR